MNPENLKQILEVIGNASVQAKQAFIIYMAFSLAEAVVVGVTILGAITIIVNGIKYCNPPPKHGQ